MRAHLRLLTANLLNDAADPAALADLLEQESIDVACFQELGPRQAEAVGRVLPHGKLDPRTDTHGLGIALRQPGEVLNLPLPRKDARVVRLDPSAWPMLDAPLEVIGVHIQAPHGDPPPWVTFPARRAQIRELVGYLERAPAPHRVVAGDLNATRLWPVYRQLARRLTDAPLSVARRGRTLPGRTWGPLFLSGLRVLRIDHVFSRGLEALDCRVHELPGSDHAAVVVDLELA